MKLLLLVICVCLNWRFVQGVQGYTKFAYGCVGQEVKIECDPGNVIRIIQAFYGQSANGERYCAYSPQDPCTENTLDVDLKCTGKEEVCLYTTGTTHRQCGGVANYIAVDFECMPKDQMINICSPVEVEDRSGYIVSPDFPSPLGESSVQCKCTISSLVPGRKIEVSEVYTSFRYAPSRDCSTWSDAVEVTDGTQSERFCKPGNGQLISTFETTNITLLHKTGTGGAMWLLYESPKQDGRVLVRCGARAEEPIKITTNATTATAAPTSVANETTAVTTANATLTTPTTENETTLVENATETTTVKEITTVSLTTFSDVNSTTSEDIVNTTASTVSSTTSTQVVTAVTDDNETIPATVAPSSTTLEPENNNTTPGVAKISEFGVTAAVVGAIVGGLVIVFLIIIALIVVYFKRVNSKDFA